MDSNKCKIRNDVKNIEIIRFDININECNHKLFKSMFGVDKLPLSLAHVELEIKNVSLSVVNTIRRLLLEIQGKSLFVQHLDVELSTDPYVETIKLCENIKNIPLKLQIDSNIIKTTEFYIDETNDSPIDKVIYSNMLKCKNNIKPIFNPSFPLIILGAKKSLKVNNIKIVYGNDDAQFKSVFQIGMKTLDVEKYDNDYEHRNESGYKESTLTMDPLHHLLTFNFSAVVDENEIQIFMKDIFILIIHKLQKILSNNEISIIDLPDDNKLLTIIIEKDMTLIELLKKTMFDVTLNKLPNFEYNEVADGYKLSITHDNPKHILTTTIQKAIDIFKIINDVIVNI